MGSCSFKKLLFAIFTSLELLGKIHESAFADVLTTPDVSSILSPAITNAFISTVGLSMDHRSYEPATALNTASTLGLNFGLEATLVHPPTTLGAALSSLSGGDSSSSASTVPILPSVK